MIASPHRPALTPWRMGGFLDSATFSSVKQKIVLRSHSTWISSLTARPPRAPASAFAAPRLAARRRFGRHWPLRFFRPSGRGNPLKRLISDKQIKGNPSAFLGIIWLDFALVWLDLAKFGVRLGLWRRRVRRTTPTIFAQPRLKAREVAAAKSPFSAGPPPGRPAEGARARLQRLGRLFLRRRHLRLSDPADAGVPLSRHAPQRGG